MIIRRATNRLLAQAVLLATVCLSHGALAQGSAPALYGVQEVVVEPPLFEDSKASGLCGLVKADLTSALNHILDDGHLPIVDGAHALPTRMDVSRVMLDLTISTMNNDGLDCTSWVLLTAQTKNNVVLPPVNPPRNVVVIYWQKGKISASPQSSHAMVVNDVLEKMATAFVQQYNVDQPRR